MINLPGYHGQLPGMSIAGRDYEATAEQVYDPKLATRQKAEAEKSMRSFELTNIAQNLEHLRQRLLCLDLQDDADCVDGIIGHLMDRWNRERRK